MSEAKDTRANRLIHETSPYLLQHAKNPVDWYPWAPEALELAKKRDVPILLSIGYAACHWCHVMERESFENEEVARLMNRHFVCIKVDREERPDLDDIYMAATVGMTGAGGWPMTVFLTPDKQPFFAGTYFPPDSRWGRPGFRTLLERIAEAWQTERDALIDQARRITEHVEQRHERQIPLAVGRVALEDAVDDLRQSFDARLGGFGGAPKFPPKSALTLLLRYHQKTGDAQALQMVTTTLDAMKNGGIYDHVAGGFARYSTDERWLVPHFEKMLYDNAELAEVYLGAYQVTQDREYARVATETLDYLAREMQGPEGGFFSSTDADSEGVEGKFFVWTLEEVRAVLGEPAARYFSTYYDVSQAGNWEGTNILNTPRPMASVAEELGVPEAELKKALRSAKRAIYEARQRREHPLLDDKVLTAHNGLAIGAMASGYLVLQEPRFLESAVKAADYVLSTLRRPDGGLYRTAHKERAHLNAYLEDYAYLADALVSLYEVGGVARFLRSALELAERMLRDFSDPEGGGAFFQTAADHEPLIVRPREGHDGALPNPNSIAARALARLGHHLGRPDFLERAGAALTAYGASISRLPRAFTSALGVVDFLLEGPIGLVAVGQPDRLAPYRALLARRYLPNRVLAFVNPREESSRQASALTKDKAQLDDKTTIYLCEDFACRAPETDLERLEEQLEAALVRRRNDASNELSHAG